MAKIPVTSLYSNVQNVFILAILFEPCDQLKAVFLENVLQVKECKLICSRSSGVRVIDNVTVMIPNERNAQMIHV